MKKIFFLLFLSLFLFGMAEPPKPNIIVFLADDIGVGDPFVYNPNSKIPTPAIDNLADNGVIFTDAYAPTALCAPSRYSIMVGNRPARGRYPWGNWNFAGGSQVLPGQDTLGIIAQAAGYRTGFVGKWHLGGDFYRKNSNNFITIPSGRAAYRIPMRTVDFKRGLQNGPLALGFDYSFPLLRGIQDQPYCLFENDMPIRWYGGDKENTIRAMGQTLLDKARGFISGSSEPFFLMYSSQSAHLPYYPPNNIDGIPVAGETINAHTDMVYEADVVLGRLVAYLDDLGILDNTIIIFTSDNGGIDGEISQGHDATAGLRGEKGDIYEGGTRVPLIVSWPDQLEPSVKSQIISLQDIAATIAAIVGEDTNSMDSENFLPVLTTDDYVSRHYVITEADYYTSHKVAIRSGNFKLINENELYNLKTDPFEAVNVANGFPEVVSALSEIRN